MVERQSGIRYRLRFGILVLFLIATFFISFLLGKYPVTPDVLVRILLSRVFPVSRDWNSTAQAVVLNLRLPRTLAAVLIGAALSAAGASYQGMFRNPMVSPDVLGASAGAGFGAATAIFLSLGYAAVTLSSFFCGLTAVLLAYAISRRSRTGQTLAMVLAGMMIGALFSSGTSFLKLMADTDSVLPAITYWLMGGLSSIRWKDVILLRWRINLLTMGDEEAASMGVHTGRLRALVIVCATLVTAASVSVSGFIGWVGLVIPHICRLLFGQDYRRLLPACMILGGAYLLIVDDFARLLATAEIPIGILTSVIGAPVFLWLILTGGRHHDA